MAWSDWLFVLFLCLWTPVLLAAYTVVRVVIWCSKVARLVMARIRQACGASKDRYAV